MAGSTITVRTDPDIARQITALAEAMDRSRNWVIEDALKRYIAEQRWQIEGIKDALDSLDHGEGIAHETVKARMAARLEEKLGPASES